MPEGDHDGRHDSLAELRQRLEDQLARKRLSKSQLAAQSNLGRTTVQEAFRAGGPTPSAETVVGLARVLGLPAGELLELRRRAAGADNRAPALEGLGRPIAEWDPHDLEVHPSGLADGRAGVAARRVPLLSGYVRRAHDRVLAEVVGAAAEGASGMVVLVGSSSTGKTRACWEAVQPLASAGWRLWHPFDPARAEAALADLGRVAPCTVVWLNEAQHYVGDPQFGERIAAALHALLTQPGRGPVLVLGTLWPEYADRYTCLPSPDAADPHSRVRELLTARTVGVPDVFDREALGVAEALARGGDRLLASSLARAGAHGRIAQDLAGAPELLRRYEHGLPAARALLEVAMDARRLGVGLHLPQDFLIEAAADYFTEYDWDRLTADWAEAAFADLARPVHGRQAPLYRTNPRPVRRAPGNPAPAVKVDSKSGQSYCLADFLEQHGRTERRRLCPPASFWHAADAHLTRPNDLDNLAHAARMRHRNQWADHLQQRAADTGHIGAVFSLACAREEEGDWESADALYRQAIDAGHTGAMICFGRLLDEVGDVEGAEALYRQALMAGNDNAVAVLGQLLEDAGNDEAARDVYQQAVGRGCLDGVMGLGRMLERAGDREAALAHYRHAANTGTSDDVLRMLERLVHNWDAESLRSLASDEVGLKILLKAESALPVADMFARAQERARAGDLEGATDIYRQAVDAGYIEALYALAELRERAGDPKGAEAYAWQAADAAHPGGLAHLASMREAAGDVEGAAILWRQAADAGCLSRYLSMWEKWPHGLDPDGSPASPWPSRA
ncbi:tetratricopeptide repeat protein [Kitasatospora sp. NPDC093679]|uniref:tetratricopeptide repeat protein n=1 Tax=Kitasatospora sp. NPDC093679 TaxID=3154983 RepID=UPI0034327C63